MIIYSRPSTSGGHIPHCASQSTCALCFLITGAKVQRKMLPTKRFLDLVLFVNKYYSCLLLSQYQSQRYCQAIYEKVRQFLQNSRKLSTRFCRTTQNALYSYPRWYAGTLGHFVKSSGSYRGAKSLIWYYIYYNIYNIYII